MSEAKEMAEWDRTAWIAFYIPKFSKSAPRHFDEYNPLRKINRKTELVGLLEGMERNKKRLPKTISDEQFRKQFDAWIEKTDGNPG